MDVDQNPLDAAADIAKSIPPSTWDRIANTLCTSFEQIISPVVELTSGAGRLIRLTFDKLAEPEKQIVVETLQKVVRKSPSAHGSPRNDPKPIIFLEFLRSAESQADPTIQELWANLLAQEISRGQVHPEVPRILRQMCAADAQVLAGVAELHKEPRFSLILKLFAESVGFTTSLTPDKFTFGHLHLMELGLVRQPKDSSMVIMTQKGWLFIKSVTDPTLQKETLDYSV